MANLGDIQASIGADITALRRDLSQASDMFKRSTGDMASRASSSSRSIAGSFDGVSRSASNMEGKIRAALLAFVGFQAAKTAAASLWEVAAGFEAMEAQLDIITKGRGKETLEEVNRIALALPVSTTAATAAFTRLSAMGLAPTKKEFLTLIDVASIFGDEVIGRLSLQLGQAQAKGKLMAQDLNIMAEAGINARKYLTDAFQMPLEKLQESAIPIRDQISAIFEGMAKDFEGSSAKMAKTGRGVVEEFKSYATEIQRRFAELGVYEEVKKQISETTESMWKWYEANEAIITQNIPRYIENVKKALGGIWDFVSSHPELIEFGLVGFALMGRKGVVAGALIGEMYGQIKEVFETIYASQMTILANRRGEVADRIKILEPATKTKPSLFGLSESTIQDYKDELRDLRIELDRINKTMDKVSKKTITNNQQTAALKAQHDAVRAIAKALAEENSVLDELAANAAKIKPPIEEDEKAMLALAKAIEQAAQESANAMESLMEYTKLEEFMAKDLTQALEEMRRKRLATTTGMTQENIKLNQQEHDQILANQQIQTEMQIEEWEKQRQNYEHFLDRVQDLAVDVFQNMTDKNITSWQDMVDSMADTWFRFIREIAAQKIRVAIEASMKKSGGEGTGFSLGSLFNMGSSTSIPSDVAGESGSMSGATQSTGGMDWGSMFGGGGGTSAGSSGATSVVSGLMAGWETYQAGKAANEDIYGHGQMSSPELAGLNSAVSQFFAEYYGGPIMGMINKAIVMPIMNNAIWGQKNLQWGLTGGPKMEGATKAETAFGTIGGFDKHQDFPREVETNIKNFLKGSVAPVAEVIAEWMTDAQIEAATIASSNWRGDVSAKITEEGLQTKALYWFKSLGLAIDTGFGEWMADFEGSFDQFVDLVTARAAVMDEIDTVLNPVRMTEYGVAVQAVDDNFKAMKEVLDETGGSVQELTDLEKAHGIVLADLRQIYVDNFEAAKMQLSGMSTGDIQLVQWAAKFDVTATEVISNWGNIEAAILAMGWDEFETMVKNSGMELGEFYQMLFGFNSAADATAVVLHDMNLASGQMAGIFSNLELEIININTAFDAWIYATKDLANATEIATELRRRETIAINSAIAADRARAVQFSISMGANQALATQSYISQQYGVNLNASGARDVVNWAAGSTQAERDAIAEHYNVTPEQLESDLLLIKSALDYVDAEAQRASDSITDMGSSISDMVNTIEDAMRSIDDLLYRLTGGDLAPVQSAEFFANQYSSLLASAQADPANVGAFTSFVPEMLDFMSAYGGNYAELTSGVIGDLQGLRQQIGGQNLQLTMNLQVNQRQLGSVVADEIPLNSDLLTALDRVINLRIQRP
uniref:Putative tail tape measure protein n=1 Tax=viral metagenome TaxID=1070528 RepID=A0A6M3KLA1_9ZZZZ